MSLYVAQGRVSSSAISRAVHKIVLRDVATHISVFTHRAAHPKVSKKVSQLAYRTVQHSSQIALPGD